ncbi:4-hydroxybenzoate polyprenyltransferase [Microbacterium azadirachtae]|uniref:4-hydroxybenzoate polyprenyltransferase n=1 Tax=Microbacterium azadirachtae TaxID=582680 RepID=A0A1I6IT07_9MICO|nr:prenyltransferase [Microbacterium azadirachtae]SFR69370.1 4-hydroxybenzoate polyprenyltransferase [Microbacterium azadirachtae]
MSTSLVSSLPRDLLLASRPVSWINTAYGFAAAYLLTSGRLDAAFVIGTLFFLVPYNLAMYGINDVFDYASDLANPRKGGAEGAILSPARHRVVLTWSTLLPVPFAVALVVLGDPVSWLVLALSLFAVVAYSAPGLRFKEIPFVDSLTSSTHFVSPAVYGLALAHATPTVPLVLLLLAFFAWGVASHAFGAVQDIGPDREAGISSIATALGARRTVRFALSMWAVAGVLMLFTTWPGPLGALLALPYLVAVWPFRSVTDAEAASTNRGWRRFLLLNYVCGFLATMLLIWWAFLGDTAF